MKEPNSLGPRVARAMLACAFFAFAAAPCLSESAPETAPEARGPYALRSTVDWKARLLHIEVELDLAAAGLRLPAGRLSAERMIERDLPGLAKDAVFALQADSYRTIEDAISDGSFDSESLVALAGLARIERSSFSKDLRRYLAAYALRLDAVAALFLTGASPSPIREPLESRPTRDYSGIVIYAKGSLPVHGEAVEGEAKPCLFPRVYDSEMNLILDRSVVAPEALAGLSGEGGVLGYAEAIGVAAGERVGSDPLRVMALELFGDARTDYVISREDALRILSTRGNRELLRQGKVVVVY
jgi:hypothetical protein